MVWTPWSIFTKEYRASSIRTASSSRHALLWLASITNTGSKALARVLNVNPAGQGTEDDVAKAAATRQSIPSRAEMRRTKWAGWK